MAIKVGGVTVINDSGNFVGLTSAYVGTAGTQSWNSGKKSVNIDGVTGNISIDGILKANLIVPLQ